MESYLDEPVFLEPNDGPGRAAERGRPPSERQIRVRAAVIRDSWNRREERIRRTCVLPIEGRVVRGLFTVELEPVSLPECPRIG